MIRTVRLSYAMGVVSLALAVLAAAGCGTAALPVATAHLTTAAAPGGGMEVSDAQAAPIPSNGNAVSVVATIRNQTGQDDRLTGGSSPGAAFAALYATCGCSPAPTDPETGLVGRTRMPWSLVKQGESIQLRAGDGELIVGGLPEPLAAGRTIEVTFEFDHAASVTLAVPVVASTP
jgi:copper(I)-binding protein